MKKLQQIQQEIAKLERQAEKVRRDELKGVVQQIKKTMSQHGITLADLEAAGAGVAKARRGKKAAGGAKKSSGKVAPKYRSQEDSSLTWTGRGRKPLWVQAWIDAGKSLEDLLI